MAPKKQRPARNLSVVEDSCSRLANLPYGECAVCRYGNIRVPLEKMGETFGVNDLHAAAHARSLGLTLVTSNLHELERVPAPLLENCVG